MKHSFITSLQLLHNYYTESLCNYLITNYNNNNNNNNNNNLNSILIVTILNR